MNLILQNFKCYLSLRPLIRFSSYFWNTRLTRCHSPLNGHLEVWYRSGKPMLTTPNTTYSYGTLYQMFKQIFQEIQLEQKSIQRVLILGFGVGSVASVLLEDLAIDCEIDAVEHDPEIIHLGKRYFNTQRFGKRLSIFQEDAYAFIHQCAKRYDLILVDLFRDTEVPLKFQSNPFIEKICQLAHPQGMVLFNKITHTGIQIDQYRYLQERFQAQQGNTRHFSIMDKNQVIIWEKNLPKF